MNGLWEDLLKFIFLFYPEVLSLIIGAIITLFIVEKKKQTDKRNAIIQSLKEQIEISKPPGGVRDISEYHLFFTTPYWSQTLWMILNSDVLNQKKDALLIRQLTRTAGAMENHNSLAQLTNLAIIYNSEMKEKLCSEMITINKLIRRDLEELKSML
ncbi:hypothetical protein [Paenibacillus glacialis]|uniref:Uncharacterized protein n=1 Tax=Paenibacillus glacialis TaxID=494026 RepID=A0A168JZG5_9BACL|nr:hypothetical protein [Paenibacillus glacialis]OAB41312.1 hypothetical protein PGLA_16010 [Paenibacillus glacialis]